MQGHPQRHYSLDDYFAVEESSGTKHEYYNGEIFAMAGASVDHNHITANVLTLLRVGLRQSRCSAFGSDLRLQTPGGLYTYPDVIVICGQVLLTPGRPDTTTNPATLVEVLSDATRDYDRGDKFDLYKAIPTLRDYVLIEQERVFVEHFSLTQNGVWTPRCHETLDVAVGLSSVNVTLPLAEIYRQVFSA